MVPWSIYILTFLYNFTFGALVGESPRAGAILLGLGDDVGNNTWGILFCLVVSSGPPDFYLNTARLGLKKYKNIKI